MQKIRIREAVPQDAAALLEIYSYYVKNTAITFEWEIPSVQEFEDRITKTLKKYPYIVAELDEPESKKILGYAYASRFRERKAYDWDVESSIYIEKNARGKKIGEQLLNELEKRLKKQGILNINASITSPDENAEPDEHLTDASRLFHQKMGYTMVGRFHKSGFKFGRWYDMIWMEKFLGEHLEIRKAKPEELPKIMEIYHYAQDFMIQTGNPYQWAHKNPTQERIQMDIQEKRCYLICNRNEIHGVFALFTETEPEITYKKIDGKWLNDEPYLTIHRIAADGKVHGIFAAAINYCKSLSKNLRIDTHADNRIMQHLIEKNGFKKCGIIYLTNGDGTARIAYHWDGNS